MILAFDTATPATTVALSGLPTPAGGQGGRVIELRDDPAPGERPRHATRLLGLINELMEQSHTGWASIDRIAVGLGPGTFTGLRIGIATAKALARAAEIPLVGVSTLHSLAYGAAGACPEEQRAVAAILDARRGEAFAAVWAPARPGELDTPALGAQALAPDALVAALRPFGPGVLAVGDGALAFREPLEQAEVQVPHDDSTLHRVTATTHCRLAAHLPVTLADELLPDYQRSPDAQPRPAVSMATLPPDDSPPR